jgi:hypothetical protein
MRGVARWIGSPGLAAMMALPLMWAASSPAPGRPPGQGAPAGSGHPVVQTTVPHSIAGTWSLLFGRFEFVPAGAPGRFTDRVITRRLGVFCSDVNDKNGQIVLYQDKNNWRVYTGTWQWFYPQSCQFAGYGLVTVTLWRTHPYAFFTAYPPKGFRGSPDLFRIERLP